MASTGTDVLILGAGVSGLTTALVLLEAGLRPGSLRILAETPPALTTSSCAGAIWGPYLSGEGGTDEWGRYTLDRFRELAVDPVGTGVHLVPGVEAGRHPADAPSWARAVEGFQPLTAADLPAGFVSGWRYTIPVVDMPVYLAYLEKHLDQAGVPVGTARFRSLDEAVGEAGILINCTGLGARWLVPDKTVRPVRGQLVVVENPGIEEFFAEHTEGVPELTYLLPQGDHVVLGGNAEEDRTGLVPDEKIARRILRRCVDVEPRLRGAPIRGHRVGVRPTRPRIRLERADIGGIPVVHNYGHGGSGVSLSWGCAVEVARIVATI